MFLTFVRKSTGFKVSGKENGVFYDDTSYDICYKGNIDSDNHSFYGSFCSTIKGTYTFKIIGRRSIIAKKFGDFNVSGWEKSSVSYYSPTNLEASKSFELNQRTCYPFQVQMKYYVMIFGGYLGFQVKFPDSNDFVYVGSNNSIRDKSYFGSVDAFAVNALNEMSVAFLKSSNRGIFINNIFLFLFSPIIYIF